jgi:hypothetical protein
MLLATLLVGAVAGAQSRHINAASPLDTSNLLYSEQIQGIFAGRFEEVRNTPGARNIFSDLFVATAVAYGIVCTDQVAAGSPSLGARVDTKDGWGNTVSSSSRVWLIDQRFAEKASEYGVAHSANLGARNMITLFQRHGCLSQQTAQVIENMLRYAYGRPPVQQQPPEPLPRYVTRGERARATRVPHEETTTLESAFNRQLPDLSSDEVSDRNRYIDEVGDRSAEFPKIAVLQCQYIDPNENAGYVYYFWKTARPTSITDAWLHTLSADHPIRKVRAAQPKCPAKEPAGQHPLDIRATLPMKNT